MQPCGRLPLVARGGGESLLLLPLFALPGLPYCDGGTFALFLWKGENGFRVSPPSLLREEVVPSRRWAIHGRQASPYGGLVLPALWCNSRESSRDVTELLLPAHAAMCQRCHVSSIWPMRSKRRTSKPLCFQETMVVLVGVGCSVATRGESPWC